MRVHPAASRIAKLSAEAPAILILFDCLMTQTCQSLLGEPLRRRRTELENFVAAASDGSLRLSPFTREPGTAQHWLDRAGRALDGALAKRQDAGYAAGERAMLKIKRLRTADCVVGGFRYQQSGHGIGSLTPSRALRRSRSAAPCGLHLGHSRRRTEGAYLTTPSTDPTTRFY